MSEIEDRNVLITGGSRGIGVYLAHAFAQQGAHIALIARSENGLRRVASQLTQYQRNIAIFPADLSGEQARM
ncbi:MAG TPA: SDR family NAD(P)-dependent oxidoreductase, partial [bacterium]|nr:SDR family NAD(P)-dependent oxidoreductase [bacterium]